MPAVPRIDQRFPKSARIHSSLEFDVLFQSGKVLADASLVMHARLSTAQGSDTQGSDTQGSDTQGTINARGRIGISISKRVGNAPTRNRWKRLIREAYRRQFPRVTALGKLDIVVRPRRGAVANYAAIEKSLANLATRLEKQLQKQSP